MKKKKNTSSKGLLKKISDFYDNKVKKSKIKFNMLEMLIIMLIVFGIGLIIGGITMYSSGSFKGESLALNEFVSAYNEIVENYYQDVDNDKILEAGISGMIRYLGDPYSTYMNTEDAKDFSEDVEGTYQGIGAEIKYDENQQVVIGRVFESSPAEKAGLMENDILLKVNGVDIDGRSLSNIADTVKGEKGTTVRITISRDGEEKEITITRGVVDNISVTSEIITKDDQKIGYIYISTFASNTTKQFKKELETLEKDGINSLIIDVRGNTGGYLTTVTEITSMFMKKGDALYQLKTKDKLEVVYDETDESREYKVVVLADGGSASASELLVAAFAETYNSQVVGMKTYGKGKVQKVSTLSSGAMFKYTYQEWLTPQGNYIDQVGINPTVEIPYEYDEVIDNQKDRAIEVILSE